MQTMIRNAPFGVFLAMVGVPLAMAAVAIVAGWHARRQARLVTETKTSPIGVAEDGYREFQGTVEAVAGDTLVAPLTGAACCWYSAKVEQWRLQGTGTGVSRRHHWETVRTVTSSAPFFVRDASGVCAVNVIGAEVTPTDKSQWTGATLEPTDRNPPRVGPSQSTHGVVQMSGGPDGQFRYSEERIYAGDPLLVLGAFESHRFDARNDEGDEDSDEDDEDSEMDGDAGASDERGDANVVADAWTAADEERYERLWKQAAAVTKAEIGAGGRGQPLILSTAPRGRARRHDRDGQPGGVPHRPRSPGPGGAGGAGAIQLAVGYTPAVGPRLPVALGRHDGPRWGASCAEEPYWSSSAASPSPACRGCSPRPRAAATGSWWRAAASWAPASPMRWRGAAPMSPCSSARAPAAAPPRIRSPGSTPPTRSSRSRTSSSIGWASRPGTSSIWSSAVSCR